MSDSVYDAALDAAITIDEHGLVVDLNRTAETLFGYDRHAAIGMTAAELVIPARYRDAYWAGLRRIVSGGQLQILDRRLEISAMRADGAEFPVELTVTRRSEAPPRFTAWIRDLSESRALEAASARQAGLLGRVERITKSGSWQWTPDTGELQWSDNHFRIFGLEPGERTPSVEFLVGRIHADDRDRVVAVFNRLRSEGEMGSLDYRIVQPNGEIRNLRVSVAVMETDSEGRDRVLGSVQDVTEQATMEARVDQLMRQDSIGQLAGGIAHDFNNILAVITASAEFAVAELGEDSAARPEIDEIHRAAERATQLTRQLLIFSRRETAHPERLDLNHVVLQLVQMMRRSLSERVELRTRLAEGLWPVEVDRAQIEQILVNLAINAGRAMPRGGELTISTSNVELDRPADGLDADRFVRLAVSDTGSGMTAEVVQHAFEPFFTTKPPGEGSGLGLATVHDVITKAGGDVEIESEPGSGTTVTRFVRCAPDHVAREDLAARRLEREIAVGAIDE